MERKKIRGQLKDRIIDILIYEGECNAAFNTKDINDLIIWIQDLESDNYTLRDEIKDLKATLSEYDH